MEVICDDEAVPIREGAGGGFYKFSFGHINVYPPTLWGHQVCEMCLFWRLLLSSAWGSKTTIWNVMSESHLELHVWNAGLIIKVATKSLYKNTCSKWAPTGAKNTIQGVRK